MSSERPKISDLRALDRLSRVIISKVELRNTI